MQLRTILAATDDSPDGRHAVHLARRLAAWAGASLSVVRVLPVSGEAGKAAGRFVSNRTPEGVASPDLEQLRQWLGPDALNGSLGVELVLAYGVPGVEISRLAEERGADLVVLGRRARSPAHRLLLGETADALVRRCGVPVLSIPQEVSEFGCVLVAMDGNERGFELLPTAVELAHATGACLRVVTVEPERAAEPARAAPTPPPARSLRVRTAVAGVPACGPPDQCGTALSVRRGNAIEQVLSEVQEVHADVLVIGYRRGGPPKVVGPTDIARNLLYAAPSAVLTVPL